MYAWVIIKVVYSPSQGFFAEFWLVRFALEKWLAKIVCWLARKTQPNVDAFGCVFRADHAQLPRMADKNERFEGGQKMFHPEMKTRVYIVYVYIYI